MLAPPAAAAPQAERERLSDERETTLWAHVLRSTWVRAAPASRSRRRGFVHKRTFSGSAEVVLVLGRARRAGRTWYHVRYPGLGWRTGWVPAFALGPTGVARTLVVVDRGRRQVRAYDRGRLVFRAPAGIGAHGSPTPAGSYYIRERLIPSARNGIYGVFAFGISAYSSYRTDWPGGGQVGIHGTNQPGLIPGRISNGCVRLRNGDIRRLSRIASVGTPVWIR